MGNQAHYKYSCQLKRSSFVILCQRVTMGKTLYFHPASPPARAVWMVAKELNVDVEIKVIDLFAKEQMEPWFLKINPDHCVPTLVDGDFALWESRAVLRYLCNAYAPNSKLYPADPKKRAEVDKQLDKELGFNYKHIVAYSMPQIFAGAPPGDDKDVLEVFKKLDTETPIKDGKFLCGDDMTIADYIAFVHVTFLEIVKYDKFKQYAKLNAWVEKIKAMPIVKECNAGFEQVKPMMWEKMGLK